MNLTHTKNPNRVIELSDMKQNILSNLLWERTYFVLVELDWQVYQPTLQYKDFGKGSTVLVTQLTPNLFNRATFTAEAR